MLIPIPPKNLDEITKEWDGVCSNRKKAIAAGQDISLLHVTVPCIINEICLEKPNNVLDVGCGTGYLTSEMAKHVRCCIGIDCSHESILLAQRDYQKKGLSFIETKLGEYSPNFLFDMCVSNMVLTSDPDFKSSIKDIYELLNPSGTLLIMITHPCFWPKYWNFGNATWFEYNKEIFIEHDFSISLVKSIGKATYIHRSLEMYVSAILEANFIIEEIKEPYPYYKVPDEYEYKYPRFLFFKCRKKH